MPTTMTSLPPTKEGGSAPEPAKKATDASMSNANNAGGSSLLMQMMGNEKKRKNKEAKAKSDQMMGGLQMMGGITVAGLDSREQTGSAWDAAVNSVKDREIVLANTAYEDSWVKETNPDGGKRKVDIDMQRGKSLANKVAPVGMDLVRKKLAAENAGIAACDKDCGGVKF